MARTIAEIPKGSRITDHISLGVIAKYFPRLKELTAFLQLQEGPVNGNGIYQGMLLFTMS